MATRLYINRDFYHYLAPTPDAGWEKATGFQRYKLGTTKRTASPHSSLFTITIAAQGTSGNDTLLFQGVSDPLDSNQTITGNVKGQARFIESVAGLDSRAQIVIWVVKPDGTSRGTLLAMSAGGLASEFGTTIANRKVPIGGSAALSSVAALAGDRIVIEVGARQHATLGGNLSLSTGYAATDLAEDESTTAANAPWWEFTQTITFTAEAYAMVTRTVLTALEQPDDDRIGMRASRVVLTALLVDTRISALAGVATATGTAYNAEAGGTVYLAGTAAGDSLLLGRLNYIGLEGLADYGTGYDEDTPFVEPWAIGQLTLVMVLQGSAAGTSTAVGFLEGSFKSVRGVAAGTSTCTGVLSLQVGLIGSAAGTSTVSAHLSGQIALYGLAACSSYAQGSLMGLNQDEWGPFPPPNVPPERVVYIRYRGVDITPRVLYSGTQFKTSARGSPGSCLIRVRDDAHEFDFVTGGSITLDVGDIRQWGGYLATIKRGYFFEGSHDSPGEIVRYLELRGVDYNIFFQKRVLYDKVTPTNVQLTTYPPDTPDDEIIKYYGLHHLDLDGDGIDTQSLVEHVGTPSQDDEISGAAGWSWGQFLQHMRFHTGAIDYIDPDKRHVHTDVDTPTAAFGISDDPDETEVGCRDLELDFDAAKMRNDALIWGAGQGSNNPVFSRSTDSAAITQHNLWQVGQLLPVWRQATVDRIADSWVYGSPQNKRGGKDDRVAAQCVVFEPTFRVAQKVTLRSAVWNFTDVIPIRDIEIDFPTPWHPRFKLTLSHEIDDPWSTYEFWLPDFELPDFEVPDITIRLPGVPELIDPGTGLGVGMEVGSCNDGKYVYDMFTSADMYNSGVLKIRMVYSDGNEPRSLPIISSSPSSPPWHPSGNDYYMIDGNSSTGRRGYRLKSMDDAVVWQSQVPLFVSGINIYQGMEGIVAEPGRARSCWISVYASTYTSGFGKGLIGTWGGPLPRIRDVTPNRTDPNGGEPLAVCEFGLDPTDPDGHGVYYTNVKYVEVKSRQGWWFKSFGLPSNGGRWTIGTAELAAHCQFTILPGPDGNLEGGNGSAYIGPSPNVPDGEDPAAVYYYAVTSWLEGTLRVWDDGVLLRPGFDYEFNAEERWIKFPAGFDGEVYIRYYPRT